MSKIRWTQVNDEPFEYAIQQGPHGDEFVKLLDGSCLRQPAITGDVRPLGDRSPPITVVVSYVINQQRTNDE